MMDDTAPKEHAQIINQSPVAGLIRVSVPGYVKPSFIRMSSSNLILKSL